MLAEAGADELAQKVEEKAEAKVLDNVRRRQWKRSSGDGGLLLAHQTGLLQRPRIVIGPLCWGEEADAAVCRQAEWQWAVAAD